MLREALEDLRHDEGREVRDDRPLDADFLDRLEHYAEGAASKQLSSEMGTCSFGRNQNARNVLAESYAHVVDELDAVVAQKFESILTSAFNGIIPKCLMSVVGF